MKRYNSFLILAALALSFFLSGQIDVKVQAAVYCVNDTYIASECYFFDDSKEVHMTYHEAQNRANRARIGKMSGQKEYLYIDRETGEPLDQKSDQSAHGSPSGYDEWRFDYDTDNYDSGYSAYDSYDAYDSYAGGSYYETPGNRISNNGGNAEENAEENVEEDPEEDPDKKPEENIEGRGIIAYMALGFSQQENQETPGHASFVYDPGAKAIWNHISIGEKIVINVLSDILLSHRESDGNISDGITSDGNISDDDISDGQISGAPSASVISLHDHELEIALDVDTQYGLQILSIRVNDEEAGWHWNENHIVIELEELSDFMRVSMILLEGPYSIQRLMIDVINER